MSKQSGFVPIAIIVLILVVITLSVGGFLYFNGLNKPVVSPAPLDSTKSESLLQEEYENPFESDVTEAGEGADSVNPFDDTDSAETYTNPFEEL